MGSIISFIPTFYFRDKYYLFIVVFTTGSWSFLVFSDGNGSGQVAFETKNKTARHLKLTITKETTGHIQ